VCGSGAVVCSWSLLIRWAQRARCQAETPLIALFRFPGPAQNKPDNDDPSILDPIEFVAEQYVA